MIPAYSNTKLKLKLTLIYSIMPFKASDLLIALVDSAHEVPTF